jgi:hypothetical protein
LIIIGMIRPLHSTNAEVFHLFRIGPFTYAMSRTAGEEAGMPVNMMPSRFSDVERTADCLTWQVRSYKQAWSPALVFLSLLPAAVMAIDLPVQDRGAVLFAVLLAAGGVVFSVRARASRTAIVDRRGGVVRVTTGGYPGSRQRTRELREFDRVAVRELRFPLDAGYHACQYTVVLLGGKGPITLITTDDEREASAVRNEVASFLHCPPKNPDRRDGA